MLYALIFAILPLWTLLVLFTGVGLGQGNFKIHPLATFQRRKVVKAQREPKSGPNICQCEHKRSFHRQGEGECSAPTFHPVTGEPLDRLCTCNGYLSSQVTEYVGEPHMAVPHMVDPNAPKAIASSEKVHEGEIS